MRGYIGKGKALYFLNLRYLTEKPRPGLRPDGHILELLREIVKVLECASPAEGWDMAFRLNTGAREVNKFSLSNVAAYGETVAALPQPPRTRRRGVLRLWSNRTWDRGRSRRRRNSVDDPRIILRTT